MKKLNILYIFVLAILLMGCGKSFDVQSDDTVPRKNKDLIVVGVSQVGSESVWRTANTASLQRVFTSENGYMMIFDNARQKQENQIKAIRNFISQGVDYIVFSPITEEGWEDVLKEAKEAKIPVILMDRKIKAKDKSLYTAWVGSDFEKEGTLAGKWLEEYLEENPRKNHDTLHMIMLLGTKGSTSVLGRSEGFDNVLKTHENWQVLESIDADYTTAMANEEMRKAIIRHNDIDVVVCQNDDMAFGAIEAIKDAGLTPGINGDIIIISFDAVKEALKLVSEGTIGVDVECNPDQGPYIHEIIQAIENGYFYEKDTYVKERTFTIDTVDDYIQDRIY